MSMSKQERQQVRDISRVCDELYRSPYQANEEALHAELQRRGYNVDFQLVRSVVAEKQNALTWPRGV